jgi:DNA (cytosine-5)-methyltransferase 1
MSGRPVIPLDSRAVLIGVPDYQDARYSSYLSVGNSIVGMYELLVNSGLCGWSEDQVSKIVNPRNSGQLLTQLRQLARGTTGVLLLYFVGHGVMSEQGELCLAISDTDHDGPDVTGLEYSKIKRMLYRGTTAATRIVVLDCCYSGRAIGLGSPAQAQLADLSQVEGVYTLTASDDLADASPGIGDVPRTALTGELLDLLIRDGIPGGPAGLTLGDIYPHLHNRLASKGLPRPNQRADDHAAAFVFASNTAVPPTSAQLPVGVTSIAPPTVAAEQLGRNWALLIWRRAGRVRSDLDGRLFGDTGQGEDVQFAADRMYWPCADWREPSLKAEVIIVDGEIQRIRDVYGIDRAATLDASNVALRVSPPLEADEIKARLPTLPFKLGDELPAVRGKHCEYRPYPDPIARLPPSEASLISSGHGTASSPSEEEAEAKKTLQRVALADDLPAARAARADLAHDDLGVSGADSQESGLPTREGPGSRPVRNTTAPVTRDRTGYETWRAADSDYSHVRSGSHVMPVASGQGSPTTTTPDSHTESGWATRGEMGTSVELFTGCGGLALAMHETGFRHLLTVEWNEQACSTLLKNAAAPYSPDGPDPASLDDPWPLVSAGVRAVDFSRWTGAVDMVAGGVACQLRSLGNAMKGYTDPHNLWPELFRCVRETRPLAAVAVGSRELLRASFKPYYDYILREFAEPFEPQVDGADWRDHDRRIQKAMSRPGSDLTERYDVHYQLVNAADYGVPQACWRVFVVAFRKDLGLGNWVFPEHTHSESALRQYQESGEYWARHRIRSPMKVRHTITDPDPFRFRPWVTLRDAISGLPEPVVGSETAGWLHHYGWPGAREYAGHRPNELDRPAKTVRAGVHGVPGGEGVVRLDDGSLRHLTVREVARIMTFPDHWWLAGPRGEQMRQLANAVPVALGRAITDSIASALQGTPNVGHESGKRQGDIRGSLNAPPGQTRRPSQGSHAR